MDKINVGLIGFGTVGSGLVKVLNENKETIKKKLGAEVVLKRIADKDTETDRGVDICGAILSSDADDILNDDDIAIVVELIGGTGAAKDITLKALDNGKHVVTANKALLSTFGREIFGTALKKDLSVGFEASVGGGIPVLKSLREGLAANDVESIFGIINGTANYILTEMGDKGARFEDVLKDAQEKGYAEADPTYDVEGNDTAHKLALLIEMAFGAYIDLADIYTEGISQITPADITFAEELGYKIKLLAVAKNDDGVIEARVHPTMLKKEHLLSSVNGVFNAVFIDGDAVGSTMFYGQGAGMMATASAVAADVVDICRDIIAGAKPRVTPLGYVESAMADKIELKEMALIEVPYYIRFTAVDKPEVLSKITGVLGEHNISIASVIQEGEVKAEGGSVPLVILTHKAREGALEESIKEIEGIDGLLAGKTLFIRVEES